MTGPIIYDPGIQLRRDDDLVGRSAGRSNVMAYG